MKCELQYNLKNLVFNDLNEDLQKQKLENNWIEIST